MENRIREIRKEKGWSMVELAIKAKVGYSNLSRWEKQQQMPCRSTAEKLATALGTSVEDLFGKDVELKEIG